MTTTIAPAASAPYLQPAVAIVATLESDAARGLAAAEARARLERFGRNELPADPPVPAWRRFLAQFQDPLTILLLVATLISFVAWIIDRAEALPYESITILAIVLLNGGLGYVQENRAEQAVAALRAMSSPNARVLRDGQPHTVPAAEIVPGDILLIEEGDTLPADGRVLESVALRMAEAALTGESASVAKDGAQIDAEVGLADQSNMVFSGTAAAAGRGRAVVTATGAATELGKIAGSLQQAEEEPTPLQKELAQVGRLLGIVVIVIAVVMSVTILLLDEVTTFSALVDVLLLAVSLAVAAVPEGLTAITTIVLSLGMQRMAQRNVIVRKLSAVETLGSTTVICSDKTGTLTKNEMTVRAVVTAGGRVDLTGIGYDPVGELLQKGHPLGDPDLLSEVERALRAADLDNNATLVEQDGRWSIQGDPTEGALVVAYAKLKTHDQELRARSATSASRPANQREFVNSQLSMLNSRFPRIGEVPFSSERKLMSTTHVDAEQADRVMVFSKGAPDVLLARCTHERVGGAARPLTAERRAAIHATIEQLATEALRTLGVAYRSVPISDLELPILDMRRSDHTGGQQPTPMSVDGHDQAIENLKSKIQHEDVEQNLVFLGVIGMIDPPRPEARQAVAEARQASIRPIMITGDHPSTAAAIATELGIIAPGAPAVVGTQLQQMDLAGLQKALGETSVFARVAPEHKLQLVRALKANGEIVAMTGDGVNDAPALKVADIGVAMGVTGTDVSKGAADMILTDDNFASIVAAVEEGRAIFANIQKFLRYLLSSNIGEVFVMFFGVLLARVIGLLPEPGQALVVPLLATQILWINLLTDAGPALALGVEPADHGVMERPPRDPRSRVIDRRMWFDIVYVGAVMAIGTLAVMDWALPGGLLAGASGSIAYAHTLAFTTLVFSQLFNVFNARFDNLSAFHKLASNRWLWLAVLVSVVLQVAVIYTPFLQRAFGTVPLSLFDWLLCVAVGSTVLWLMELKKLIMMRTTQ
ncbi:MAG TPA: cation-translocating P-type ATPase [Roseiflexaceae bacterium]|nr:cation-translocating P-type ATPase [Roseiflexaceae bacterium]